MISVPASTIKPEIKAQTSSPMTKLQHRFLIRCIGGLKRTHDARFYKDPVDPVKMNIPSYFSIISHPMDMGTIEQKLKAGQYSTVDDVISEFDLMVNNAVTFNGAEHPVAKEGISLRAAFNRHLSKLPGVDEVEPPVPEKKRSGSKKSGGNKSGAAKREPRPSGGRSSIASQSQTFALSPEGLPLIRRDSTTADGRPKRSIHPPKNRDLPYSAKPKKKKYVWELKFCQEALDEMFKPKHYQYASAFYLPVDPVALNIPNYHSIIKRPMDLGTIQNKLKANLYENAKEFEADVRLMFKNCYRFNINGDPTYTAGQKLNDVFDKKWATKDRWLHAHEPPNARHEHDSAADTDEEAAAPATDEDNEESEADVDEEKLAALRRQMEELSKQVEVLSQKKKKTPPAPKKKGSTAASGSSKAPRTSTGGGSKKASAAAGSKAKKGGAGGHGKKEKAARWVSYQEKQLISNVISTLPEKQMNEALSIIQRNAPSLIGSSADGEIELDIDELPNEVLLKLLNFVKKHVPQAVAELEESSISTYSHHSHAPVEPEPLPSLAGNGRPKKNKPMNASEQEAQINRLEDRLEMFKKGGGSGGRVSGGAGGGYGGINTVNKNLEMDSSDDEDSEESEEE
ncbi:hypothetical protein KEM54_005439 [Ascosphaera aggregata]|nr:hypothetical protein KEM54_005439 [Ascosphaera aggregata]